MTASAEQTLWTALRKQQLGGWQFQRNAQIGPYVADFACHERNLVIEVDHHQRNRSRDEYMIHAGYSVFHVPAGAVLENHKAVCQSLLAILENRLEDFMEPSHHRR
jgi:very-short-patch-repair endonuclease